MTLDRLLFYKPNGQTYLSESKMRTSTKYGNRDKITDATLRLGVVVIMINRIERTKLAKTTKRENIVFSCRMSRTSIEQKIWWPICVRVTTQQLIR